MMATTDTTIAVGDEVRAEGDLSRDQGMVIELRSASRFALVSFELSGELNKNGALMLEPALG